MIKLNNTFVIGCLVQWYEIELVGEYIESLKESINQLILKRPELEETNHYGKKQLYLDPSLITLRKIKNAVS